MNKKQKNVLIVDDDQHVLVLLEEFIKDNGCIPFAATTVEKGLAIARTNNIDLVLMDIVLPDTDGVEGFHQFRRIMPEVPVIMITGYNDVERARECLVAGASDYITKPFDFDYLKTSILINILSS